MKPDSLAIIHLTDDNGPMFRAAAFVFQTEGGITWVEPAYADPYGVSMPAVHSTTGKVVTRQGEAGFTVQDGEHTNATVYAVGDGPDDSQGGCEEDLEVFVARLQEKGTTLEAERVRVAEDMGLAA